MPFYYEAPFKQVYQFLLIFSCDVDHFQPFLNGLNENVIANIMAASFSTRSWLKLLLTYNEPSMYNKQCLLDTDRFCSHVLSRQI